LAKCEQRLIRQSELTKDAARETRRKACRRWYRKQRARKRRAAILREQSQQRDANRLGKCLCGRRVYSRWSYDRTARESDIDALAAAIGIEYEEPGPDDSTDEG